MNDDKFDYFMEQTNLSLSEIRSDVKSLISFRLMLLGGAFAISALSSVVLNLLFLWIGVHR